MSREIHYGQAISRLTGGKHFVVSTSVNGRGPLVPSSRGRYGNEVLCNPPGRGLGPLPTFRTAFPRVDAFAWIGQPGKSAGPCNGGTTHRGRVAAVRRVAGPARGLPRALSTAPRPS